MSYYVLKHSAKGTTWGEHKYIRKEGNRYIYPEDVKKNGNAYKERQEELNEENTKPNMQQEKILNDYLKTISKDLAVDTITEYEHERLYKNDPKYRELSDKYDVEFDTRHAGSYSPEYEKEKNLKTASENKQNRILSEAKKVADNHRQELKDKKAKEEHDSRAAQAAAEKETYLKRAENKKKVENKRDRLAYIRNARKTRNRDKKYVVDTEDGGAFVTRNREKAVQVRNEVKQNKLKREDPIKYYLQRRRKPPKRK